jgi:hypothetical protein
MLATTLRTSWNLCKQSPLHWERCVEGFVFFSVFILTLLSFDPSSWLLWPGAVIDAVILQLMGQIDAGPQLHDHVPGPYPPSPGGTLESGFNGGWRSQARSGD